MSLGRKRHVKKYKMVATTRPLPTAGWLADEIGINDGFLLQSNSFQLEDELMGESYSRRSMPRYCSNLAARLEERTWHRQLNSSLRQSVPLGTDFGELLWVAEQETDHLPGRVHQEVFLSEQVQFET